MKYGPLLLAVLALFLVPILGGQVVVDPQPLEPGFQNLLRAVFGGSEAPLLSQSILIALSAGSFIWVLTSFKVVQLPKPALGLALLLFAVLLVFASVVSPFKFAALVAIVGWLGALLPLAVVTPIAGRRIGPRVLLTAVYAGTVVLACLAVLEYGTMRTVDPTWRVFGTWVNPNALAAMLQLGLLAGLGVVLQSSGPWRLAGIASGAVIGLALLLTQSKGVYITVGLGFVLFGLLVVLLKAERAQKVPALASLAAILALGGLLGFGLTLRAPSSAAAPLGRVAAAGDTAQQSAGFRKLLWIGAAKLVQIEPAGTGLGSYRYVSAKPGLTTQTQLAHNSYLQLAVEASPLAPALLLAFGAMWLWEVAKGLRKAPFENSLARSAVISAVVAVGAHAMLDSDLHYFGVGFAFFAILGIGLVLAPDGVVPERLPSFLRVATGLGAALLVLATLKMGLGRLEVTQGLAIAAMGDRQSALQKVEDAAQSLSIDADAYYTQALLTPQSVERRKLFQLAVDLSPSTRHLRALAREQASAGQAILAIATLDRALKYDPNNLPTLALILDLQHEFGDESAAIQTAERMVKVEETQYFTVRSLPELVPTETYRARLFLARKATPERQVELLVPAVAGYEAYRLMTLPKVAAMEKQGASFGGESLQDAAKAMENGAEAARLLASAYRALGESGKASALAETIGLFEGALAEAGGVR